MENRGEGSMLPRRLNVIVSSSYQEKSIKKRANVINKTANFEKNLFIQHAF